jgi:hypothetical protein
MLNEPFISVLTSFSELLTIALYIGLELFISKIVPEKEAKSRA